MLFDASAPLPNPVQLQARLAAVMSMLEAQHSAVERLQGERDTFRVERDAANAEVEKLQLIIKPPLRNRGALPAHLPRVEIVIDVEDKRCPCCGGAMHVIGEDVAEMLDVVPALYQVKVIRRPRYGCRGCESAVVQAP